MLHTQIQVKKGKKKSYWDIVHNLDEVGLDLMAAFDNYVARFEAPTDSGFCEYVRSKDPANIFCITKEHYNRIAREEGEKEI